MKKTHIYVLILAGVVFLAGLVYISFYSNKNTESLDIQETNNQTLPVSGSYVFADIETHNNESSCWVVINDGVYDLTSWIAVHPGGPEAILGLCGTDGTLKFTNQHQGQEKPEKELSEHYIGSLKK